MPTDPGGAITAILQRWLEAVPATAYDDPISPALKRATKEAEERIAQLERDVRAYRKLSPVDRSLTADRLRATLGAGTIMEVHANAEHQAFQALTEPETPYREELLTALTEYYTRALSTAILSRETPANPSQQRSGPPPGRTQTPRQHPTLPRHRGQAKRRCNADPSRWANKLCDASPKTSTRMWTPRCNTP